VRRTARGERRGFLRVCILQSATLLAGSAILCFFDAVWARSFLAGGGIAILPQLFFVLRATRPGASRSPRAAVRAAYAATAGRFLLSAAGFALVFAALSPVSGPGVFSGFVAMLALQTLCNWQLLRRRSGVGTPAQDTR